MVFLSPMHKVVCAKHKMYCAMRGPRRSKVPHRLLRELIHDASPSVRTVRRDSARPMLRDDIDWRRISMPLFNFSLSFVSSSTGLVNDNFLPHAIRPFLSISCFWLQSSHLLRTRWMVDPPRSVRVRIPMAGYLSRIRRRCDL